MAKIKTKKMSFKLSLAVVDEISELTVESLNEGKIDRKDVIRMRLSVEEVLLKWVDMLGEGAEGTYQCGKRLGLQYITLSLTGIKADPYKKQEESGEFNTDTDINILASLGMTPSYQYSNGENRITLMPKKKKANPMVLMGVYALSGILFGVIGSMMPIEVRTMFTNNIIKPLLDTFMGFLSALAGPLMFLSVVWGIYNIGDVATLGQIGKKIVGRFAGITYISLLLCTVISLPFYRIARNTGSSGGGELEGLFKMLLNIIPKNMLTPFTEGNTLQIMFLAVLIGMAMVVLNKKTIIAVQFVEQSNYIVQLIMGVISSMIPIFIFISIIQMIMTGAIASLVSAVKLVILFLCCSGLILVLHFIVLSQRKKIPLKVLVRKLLPTFAIAVTTASSTAAFASNVEVCEKEIGIEKNLVNFGIPLGTVIFKPSAAIIYLSMSLFMADFYDVAITFPWLFTAILISGILSIASPPIPGGGLSDYTVLFAQLGIPLKGLAIAIALDVVLDFVCTAVNISCTQIQITMLADKLGMLDDNILKS